MKHLPARNEVVHAFASHDKVRSVFGEREPVPLKEGVSRMARWAQAAGPAIPVRFDRIEVEKNLPSSWRD